MPPSGGFRLFPTDRDPYNLALRRDKGGRGRGQQQRCVGSYFERKRAHAHLLFEGAISFCRDYADLDTTMWGNERENKKLKWRGLIYGRWEAEVTVPAGETAELQKTPTNVLVAIMLDCCWTLVLLVCLLFNCLTRPHFNHGNRITNEWFKWKWKYPLVTSPD